MAEVPEEVSPQKDLQFEAELGDTGKCQAPSVRTWWLVAADLSSARELKSTPNAAAPSMALFPVPWVEAPGQYFLRLVLSESWSAEWKTGELAAGVFAYDSNEFLVDAPPANGDCMATPNKTEVLQTISLTTFAWEDDDLPLLFTFSFMEADKGKWQFTGKFAKSDTVEQMIGNVGINSFRAHARDQLGSKSVSPVKTFELVKLPKPLSKEQLTNIVNDLKQLDDDAATSAVGSVAAQTNDPGMADALLDALPDSDSLADEPSSEAIGGFASSLAAVTNVATGGSNSDDEKTKAVPTGTASKVVGKAMGAADAAMGADDGLDDDASEALLYCGAGMVATVATAPARPLSSDDPDQPSVKSAQENLSEALVEFVAVKLASANLKSKSLGYSGEIKSGNMTVKMAKLAPAAEGSDDENMKVGDFDLPADIVTATGGSLSCSGGGALEVANTQWGSNPQGFAGNSTTGGQEEANAQAQENAAASGEGAVLPGSSECCSVVPSVQSMEVGYCGQKLKVNNLKRRINFSLPCPVPISDGSVEITYDPTLQFDEITKIENSSCFCTFWNTTSSSWSSEGCESTGRNDTHIFCSCNHLSSFAGAFGSAFGKLGNNGLGMLMKEPIWEAVDFTHGPFLLVLGWFALLYLPCFYCCWRDSKDYPALSKREDLFKDKVPKGSTDFLCMVMPGFRICSGFVMCMPIFINCSKLKRRLKWLFCGGCCRQAAEEAKHLEEALLSHWSVEELLADTEQSTWITRYGPEVMVEGAGHDSQQLLWQHTEPPMRQGLHDAISLCRYDYLQLLKIHGVNGMQGKKGSMKEELRMQSKFLWEALKGARDMHKARFNLFKQFSFKEEGKKSNESLGKMPSRQLLFQIEVCHTLLSHRKAVVEEDKQKREAKLKARASARAKSSHGLVDGAKQKNPERPDKHETLVSKYEHAIQTGMIHLMSAEKFVPMAPLVPPLNSFRVTAIEVPYLLESHQVGDTLLVKGEHYFMWAVRGGEHKRQLAMHGTKMHGSDNWTLNEWSRSRILDLRLDRDMYASTDNAESVLIPLENGHDLIVALCNGSGPKFCESVNTWCQEMSDPVFWPEVHEDAISVALEERPFGWQARPRHVTRQSTNSNEKSNAKKKGVGEKKLLDTHRPKEKEGVGLVIEAVVPGSVADSLNLKPGMVLLELEGKDVRQVSSSALAQYLILHPLPMHAVWSKPLETHLEVTMDDPKGLHVVNRGMVLYPKDVDNPCGLKLYDEILEIDGERCYEVLGEQRPAAAVLQALRKRLAKRESVRLGIIRHSHSPLPPDFPDICGLESVFRYSPAITLPHTAAGPFVVSVEGSPKSFIGDVWFSHGGHVLSMQPRAHFSCLGVYLEDVTELNTTVPDSYFAPYRAPTGSASVSHFIVGANGNGEHAVENGAVTQPYRNGEHELEDGVAVVSDPVNTQPPPDDHVRVADWNNPLSLWRTIITLEASGESGESVEEEDEDIDADEGTAAPISLSSSMRIGGATQGAIDGGEESRVRGEESIIDMGVRGEESIIDIDNFVLEDDVPEVLVANDSATEMHFLRKTHSQVLVANEKQRIAHGKIILAHPSRWVVFKSHVRLIQCLKHTYMAIPGEDNLMHHQLENDPSLVGLERSMTCKMPRTRVGDHVKDQKNYGDVYQAFTTINASKEQEVVKPGDVAGKVAYHFWSKPRLVGTILKREHVFPKLFKRMPPLTRVERWATLTSALQTAFFFQTMMFSPVCFMEPKPGTCKPKKKAFENPLANFLWQFLPTSWDIVAATVFGLCTSVPVPFICTMLFKKSPVMERLSDEEKRFKLRMWRFWTTVGWCFVFACQGFIVYWLSIFANEYDWAVFSKWVKAGFLSLLHRFLSAPLLRGSVFLIVLLISLVGGCCDPTLAFFPHILPMESLKRPPAPVAHEDHHEGMHADHAAADDHGGVGDDAGDGADDGGDGGGDDGGDDGGDMGGDVGGGD